MLRGRALRLTALPVCAAVLFSGCYRYVPITADVVVGGAYRGHLSAEGSQRVAPLVGVDIDRFDGRIVSVLDTAYLIAMSATVKRADPRATVWTGEQLMIPRSAVSRFELRELDRSRTMRAVALSGLGMLVVGGLVLSVSGFVGGSNPGPITTPP
jgi:hypothetical protein